MEDLTGKKFSRLTVLGFAGRRGNNYYWECQCDCGNIRQVQAQGLRRGSTKSCGCYNREIITKHGLDGDKLYHVFNSMRNRCYSVNNNSYHNYGGRGIAICDEWLNDVTVFIEWAHNNGYTDGLTIDRIDVNGNYEPSNCRWISLYDNVLHARRTKYEYTAICPQGNIYTFTIASQFEREHSLVKGSIVRCCVNNKPYKGWQFKRKPIE